MTVSHIPQQRVLLDFSEYPSGLPLDVPRGFNASISLYSSAKPMGYDAHLHHEYPVWYGMIYYWVLSRLLALVLWGWSPELCASI